MVDNTLDPKFKKFEVHCTRYKEVKQHSIDVNILIPKSLTVNPPSGTDEKKIPLIIRFHGGGLMSGSSIYAPWFPDYILTHAYQNSAIVISSDHQLLPESNGLDILSDLSSLSDWVQNSLQSFVSSLHPSLYLSIDTSRILATGESAGGYLVVQAALSHLPGIRAIISAYPMLDLKAPHFTQAYEKILAGAPMVHPEIIERHLSEIRTGEVVSKSTPPDRVDLANAIIQQGRFLEFFGEEKELFPLDRLETFRDEVSSVAKGGLPRLWIYHGRQDTGVPADGSVRFAEEASKLWGEELRLDLPDGEHGLHRGCDLETTAWLRNGVEWVTEKWLPSD